MRRIFGLVLVAMAATFAVGLGGAAQAGSSRVTAQSACAKALKEEFGAAKVTYRRFRKIGGRTMVQGTLQMKDGSTRPILCQVQGQTVSDLKFGSGGNASNAWTDRRPPNAGYIESEEEKAAREAKEKAAEEKAAKEAKAKADAVRPGVKIVPGAKPEDAEAAGKKPEAKAADKKAKPEEKTETPPARASRFKRAPGT